MIINILVDYQKRGIHLNFDTGSCSSPDDTNRTRSHLSDIMGYHHKYAEKNARHEHM